MFRCIEILEQRNLTRAKAQRSPSSEGRDELSERNSSPLFSDLCGPFDVAQDMLGVPSAVLRTCFAGDIPRFGCGSAALGTPRLCGVIRLTALIGFETAQRRNDLRPKEVDRPHQIIFGDVADIELAKNSVEQSLGCGRFDFFRHGLGRSDEG